MLRGTPRSKSLCPSYRVTNFQTWQFSPTKKWLVDRKRYVFKRVYSIKFVYTAPRLPLSYIGVLKVKRSVRHPLQSEEPSVNETTTVAAYPEKSVPNPQILFQEQLQNKLSISSYFRWT